MTLVSQELWGTIIYLLLHGLLCFSVSMAVWCEVSVENLSVHLSLALGSFAQFFLLHLFASLDVLLKLRCHTTSCSRIDQGVSRLNF